MHLEYTPEQQRLRTELRTYFATLVPDNAYARYAEPAAQKRFYRDTVRRLGADGWLGVGWPKEYGGRGLTPMEQFIFFDEAAQAGVPLPLMALNTVGPTIMRFGTDEQKAHFLPGILAPDQHPRLALHDHQLLREHPRPGLPPRGRGEQGPAAHHQPAQPRAGHPRRPRHDGGPRSAQRPALGRRHRARRRTPGHRPRPGPRPAGPHPHPPGRDEAAQLADGRCPPRRHPHPPGRLAVRVYGSEARRDAYAWLMEIVGSGGALKEGSAGAVLHGELERGYRSAVVFTFGGGNNEIQREIISWIGLGMPRVRR